jgi:imidazolonepropionase-like amidohydrolase
MGEDSDEVMLQRAVENARAHLRSGVTTVRDLGARGRVGFALKDTAMRGGPDPMPALLVCGRPVTAPRGHFWFCGEEAEGPEGMRESVRRLAGEGADVIKVMVTGGGSAGTDRSRAYLSVEELVAVVDEAHGRGLRVVVHAQGTPGIRNAVAARVDVIEHCDFLGPDGKPHFDMGLAGQIAESGIYVDPTLHVLRISVQLLTSLAATRPLSADEQMRLDSFRIRYEAGRANVERFRQMGVRLVGGTDAIRRFGDYYLTYEIFRECGLPPGESLATVTSVAAESMGIGDEVGRLAPGLAADVLILEADPARDDLALRRVRQVYRRGEAVL